MRRLLCIPILMLFASCQTYPSLPNADIQAQVQPVISQRVPTEIVSCRAEVPATLENVDLANLWNLALTNNPELREATAEIEVARGRFIQSGKYPNPRFVYSQETIGNSTAPSGALKFELNQEIVTGGKRRLEMAIATRSMDTTHLELEARKAELLARLRRLYYDYQNWQNTLRVNSEVVDTLEQGVAITRKQVEQARTRPRTDLLRLEALLKEARIGLSSNRANLEASWKQLAAEIGLPSLPLPGKASELLATSIPAWEAPNVLQRVLSTHSSVKLAQVEVQRASLEVDRARAEVIPNVLLGGGYNHDYVDRVKGGVVSAETAIPIWDRNQGNIHKAEAKWARAQAGQQTAITRLSRDTAEAFGRYQAARQQVEQLSKEVLPAWMESLESLRKAYQAGSTQITFADVLQAQVSLNETQLKIADARRVLWQAIADLQGLMELEVEESF